VLVVVRSGVTTAAELIADPADYRDKLQVLQPGDTLHLRAGTYTDGLPIAYWHGTRKAPIIISGPSEGAAAIFLARRGKSTVSIVNSSHVTVRRLTLDGQGLPVDGVKAEGYSRWAHDITIEDLVIRGHGHDQQTVGISTKCPAWRWTIRRNVIVGSGTGIYLGNSDGTDPFFSGLVEHNLVADTLGYNLQIKHQTGRLLQEEPVTIIRHNVFSKANNAAPPPDARPNVLVGHWPATGPGASDQYEIYGNLFYQNPHEALFQGEGNIALYNNLFINEHGDAIHIQPHNDIPKTIDVFFNTVLARDKGIIVRVLTGAKTFRQRVIANAVFAELPLAGGIQEANTVGKLSDAAISLRRPFGPLGEIDLTPRPGQLRGTKIDVTGLEGYLDWDRDFDGYRRDRAALGAYSSSGTQARWRPRLQRKPSGESARPALDIESNGR
jgi:hypothetical protein